MFCPCDLGTRARGAIIKLSHARCSLVALSVVAALLCLQDKLMAELQRLTEFTNTRYENMLHQKKVKAEVSLERAAKQSTRLRHAIHLDTAPLPPAHMPTCTEQTLPPETISSGRHFLLPPSFELLVYHK